MRTIATVRQAADLDALPIALPSGREVRLDQVATVHDSIADRTQAALLDGKPVVGFKVFRAKGFDETRVAEGVRATLKQLEASDSSLRFTPVSGTVSYTLEQYAGSMSMLYEGALLAVLVVWAFLRDWRATLVAAAALPLSILPAFAAMAWLGYSLNTLTLLALAVVVEILVDDAIVEVENIERHSRMGKPIPASHRRCGDGNSARRHRHDDQSGGGVPADRNDERRAGALLQAVRLDGGDRGSCIAAGRSPADTDDGRLSAEAAQRGEASRGWARHAVVSRRCALVYGASEDNGAGGRRVLPRLAGIGSSDLLLGSCRLRIVATAP